MLLRFRSGVNEALPEPAELTMLGGRFCGGLTREQVAHGSSNLTAMLNLNKQGPETVAQPAEVAELAQPAH